MHPTAAEIGDLIMQITVFLGALAEDVIITKGVVVVDGRYLSLFDLFGQNGIGFQGECVG